MDIPAEQVAYKKVIGKLGNNKVFEIGLIGGLHLVIVAKNKPETLGMGSHPAVARHIARKKEPDLDLTELAKAEEVDSRCYEHLIPVYEEMTDRIRAIQGL